MNTREAIVSLLDDHTERLGLTRRQVADLSGVNAGQLSNWLRTAGPLAFTKEGLVAQVVLDHAGVALKRAAGGEQNHLRELCSVLLRDGPRARLLAAKPEAAEQGNPIAKYNPRVMKRQVDEQLLTCMTGIGSRVLVLVGAPKMGKSSALLRLQQDIERTREVFYIDLQTYIDQRPSSADEQTAGSLFYTWLSRFCQDQVVGGYGATWEDERGIVPWLNQQIIPATNGKPVQFVFDHLDRLGEENVNEIQKGNRPAGSAHWEFHALAQALGHVIEARNSHMPILQSVGFALALDPNSCGIPAFSYPPVLGAHSTVFVPESQTALMVGKHEIGELLRSEEITVPADERSKILELTGGHVFLVQAYVSARKEGDVQAAKDAVDMAKQNLSSISEQRWRNN